MAQKFYEFAKSVEQETPISESSSEKHMKIKFHDLLTLLNVDKKKTVVIRAGFEFGTFGNKAVDSIVQLIDRQTSGVRKGASSNPAPVDNFSVLAGVRKSRNVLLITPTQAAIVSRQ